jgi:hypothetical protein
MRTVPYLKKNAKHGLVEETECETRCDLIVYRIIVWEPAYLCVFS